MGVEDCFLPKTHVESNRFMVYMCRNCHASVKVFAVILRVTSRPDPNRTFRATNTAELTIVKIAERPRLGERIPPRLRRFTGDHFPTLEKAWRSEQLGFGIGAFAYYRRVVEDSWKKILGEMRRAADKLDNCAGVIADIDSAMSERQFSKSIASIKTAFPEELRVHGSNPLLLLHSATSIGLHGLSDEDCLTHAHDVRVVLVEMVERVDRVLSDARTSAESVKRLRSLTNAGKPNSDKS